MVRYRHSIQEEYGDCIQGLRWWRGYKATIARLLTFEDYKNCIEYIVWKLGKEFRIRGSIKMSELTFNKVTIGILNGLCTVVLIKMSELTFNKVTISIFNGLHTVVLHPSDTEKMNLLNRILSVGMPVWASAQWSRTCATLIALWNLCIITIQTFTLLRWLLVMNCFFEVELLRRNLRYVLTSLFIIFPTCLTIMLPFL